MEIFKQITLSTLLLSVIFFILLIWNVILSIKLKELKKRFNRFTRGGNLSNLEQVIEQYMIENAELKLENENNKEQIQEIKTKLAQLKGKISIIRYNAFGEEGNDLSYSLAMMDEKRDGVVITSIYNRGQSNTYAKPIKNGTSNYKLSNEELSVIEMALK